MVFPCYLLIVGELGEEGIDSLSLSFTVAGVPDNMRDLFVTADPCITLVRHVMFKTMFLLISRLLFLLISRLLFLPI